MVRCGMFIFKLQINEINKKINKMWPLRNRHFDSTHLYYLLIFLHSSLQIVFLLRNELLQLAGFISMAADEFSLNGLGLG